MTNPQASAAGCGAPAGGAPITDAGNQAVVQGRVTQSGSPVATGYARLLNDDGEFVAEVPLGDDGGFRFFAAPGTWTLRALSRSGNGDAEITADRGVNEVALSVSAA